MKPVRAITILMLVCVLGGCAFLDSNRVEPERVAAKTYPGLQTFQYEGVLIYYKDLSNPCDERTVAWSNSSTTDPIQPASIDVNKADCDQVKEPVNVIATTPIEQVSVPFASRQLELDIDISRKALGQIAPFIEGNNTFQIYGAAGTVGTKSEALGLARATAVQDYLVNIGVSQDRIVIMPYDPKIPGLQALVNVLEPVVL